MAPIVDGLEDDFGEQVEFRRIDAGTDEGQTAFRAYGLRGHPAYVIVDAEGAVLWTSLGEQTRQALIDQMDQVLKEQSD
jgi:hypothetical protein